MGTLEILKNVLINIREFSNADIDEENFQRTIGELKATLHQLRTTITDELQLIQIDAIIRFNVTSQKHPIERFFIRHLAPSKYGWLGLGWSKKGKYVYDLDQLELKVGGLIYKIEQEELA